MIKLIQLYFKILSHLSPYIAGRQAFFLFQKTRKKTIRKNEKTFYTLSRHFTVPHHLENIDCYELGDPAGKLVLLVHGWDSNAGSMTSIAFELVQRGYYVVAFNLPGHGFSRLKKANIKACREYFLAVVEKLYPDKPFSVIAHSFGSAVTTFALADSRFEVDKLIFLTNPNKLTQVFQEFKGLIKLSDKAYDTTIQMAEALVQRPVEEMSIEDYSEKVTYRKLLLIHDKADKVLSYSNSMAVAKKWPNSTLVALENIGHYRMLWNEYVVSSIVNFIEPAKNIKIYSRMGKLAS